MYDPLKATVAKYKDEYPDYHVENVQFSKIRIHAGALHKATVLDRNLIEDAKTHSDFDNIRESQEFHQLVCSNPGNHESRKSAMEEIQ